MIILQKSAEILVECGMYAEFNEVKDCRKVDHYIAFVDEFNGTRDFRKSQKIDPFADTLEGFKQLFTLVDYFQFKHGDNGALWVQAWMRMKPDMNMYDRLVITVRWCLEQLVKEKEE